IQISQDRTSRIAPAFSIEMQTKDEIGMQLEVHARCATSNLAIAVEQDFALPSDGLFLCRITWIKNLGARLWDAVLNQNFPGKLPEIIRALNRGRLIAISDKRNFSS